MALFMEVYGGAGLTASAVRAVHDPQRERAAAAGVRYLRYWPGERPGSVACLVEAPDREAVFRAALDGTLPVPEVTELFGSPARWAAVEAVD